LAVALFVGFHFMVPGPNAAALKHDHTKQWSSIKVPHRAANVLERRLREVASLVRVGRCWPEGALEFSSGPNWPCFTNLSASSYWDLIA
jgi:hypothetical protein